MKEGIAALMGLVLLVSLVPLSACQSVEASNFDVQSLDIVPNRVIENDKFTANAVINNVSNLEITYLVQVWVDGIVEDRTTITLAPGKSQAVQFTLHKSEAGTYEIRIGDKSTSVLVEKQKPASFTLSDLKINMEVANLGEEVVITARVVNTGGSKGSYLTELTINGVVEQSDKAVMEPGASYNTVFKVTKAEAGTYTVDIGDLTGKYTVQEPVKTLQVTAPTPEVQKRISQWQKSSSSCCGGGESCP